jgi:uncharacterized protein involved in exopolysaccharide biosynthesis
MDNKEVGLGDLKNIIKGYWNYLWSKRIWIFLVGFVCAVLGGTYAWLQKPVYTAEITFTPENDKGSGMGSYIGLAAQFGFDLGSGSGGVFEGDNLAEFLKSKMLIQQTLLTPVDINGQSKLLIDNYIDVNDLRKQMQEKREVKSISFSNDYQPGMRARDSIMKEIINSISESLTIEKKDKKLNFIVARMKSTNELFAKTFLEQLVNKGIEYFVEYKSKKSRENVAILQRQTDSVEHLLTGNIVSVAASSDLNVNPIRQIVRANVQRKQVDVQVTSQVYGELLKQLELSKISLRKETPLIQIIDRPLLPLEKEKMGRLKGAILFGFAGVFLFVAILLLRRVLSSL